MSSSSEMTTEEKKRQKEEEAQQRKKEKQLLELNNDDIHCGFLYYDTIKNFHWNHLSIKHASSTEYLIEEMS